MENQVAHVSAHHSKPALASDSLEDDNAAHDDTNDENEEGIGGLTNFGTSTD